METKYPLKPEDITRLSFSGIDMYHRCAEQFRRRYLLGEKQPPDIALVEGDAYHQSVELQNIAKRDGKPTYRPQALVENTMEVVRKRRKEEDVPWGDESEDRLYERAKALWPDYMTKIDPKIEPEDVEVEIAKDIEVAGSVFQLNGWVDLVTKKSKKAGRTIRDYKTAKAAKSERDVEQSLQLHLYSWGVQISEVGLITFVKSANPYCAETRLVPVSPARQAWALEVARRTFESIRLGSFPVCAPGSMNWWCQARFCGYWDSCRGRYEKLGKQVLK